MVRLTLHSFLHLLPEEAGAEFEHPFYARVTQVEQDEVTFSSLEGGGGTVSREIALASLATAREVNAAEQLSFLRHPVSVEVDGQVHHGQVTAVDGEHITVNSAGDRLTTTANHISPVPPVVALLLERVEFGTDEWSDYEIEHVQSALLDRLLGRNGEVATNVIADVFKGLMSPGSSPASDQLCEWVEPSTGEATQFLLQHALDFAHFVDGGRGPVPENGGLSFCRIPTRHVPQNDRRSGAEPEEVLALFDPFIDDDASPQHVEATMPASPGPPSSSKRSRAVRQHEEEEEEMQVKRQQHRRVCSRSALDKDALIIDKIGDDRDLLERFLDIRRQEGDNGIALNSIQQPAAAVAREPLTVRKKHEQTSKYSFTPQLDQQYVYDQVTSEKHRGKSPHAYIHGLVRSDAVKFKALLGICTRAFDIRFGSKGISIRHFARLVPEERVAWLQGGGSNFDNLSATAEFKKAAPAACIDDVVDSIRVFLTYAREYCCGDLIGLAEAILRFVEEMLMRVTWEGSELLSVVYWVNDVLEDFREAVASDNDVKLVQLRCSTEDRLLRDLMFVKLHRQVDALKQRRPVVSSNIAEGKRPATRQLQPVRDNNNRHGRMPKTVLKRLPVYTDPATNESRALCMRFLSNAGCHEENGSCASDRAHFVPKHLPDIVKAEIKKRFGGLKSEHRHL